MKSLRGRLLPGFLRGSTLTFVLLGTLGLSTPPSLAASLPDWAEAPVDEEFTRRYADQDAVVLLDHWEITLKGGQRTGTRRWAIKVLTEDGRMYAAMPLARGSFDTFSRVKVWVRDPAGSVRFFGEDEGTLFSLSNRRFLDDTEILLLQPRGISPGSTMAVEYHFRSLPDIPCDLFPIQGPVPVRHSRLHVDARGGWRVRAKVSPGKNTGPIDVTEEGLWEFSDLAGFPKSKQPFSPQPPRQTVVLDYLPPGGESAFADWASTARWGAGLFTLDSSTTSRIEKVVSLLRAGGGNLVDESGRLARKIRYFAIEIGWGGFRPRPPDTTLTRGFGDCKDKAELMIAILRRLGIDAVPVLVAAPMFRYVDARLASPRHFNHCIVGIPWKDRDRKSGMTIIEAPGLGPLRLFDATLSDSSGQDVPVFLEGGAALPLDPRALDLARLPESGPEDNVVESTYLWSLDASGMLKASVVRRHRGAMRFFLEDPEGELVKPDELKRQLFHEFSQRHPRIEKFETSEIRREADGTLAYEVTYTCPSALSSYGDAGLLELTSLVSLDVFPVPNEKKGVSVYQPFRSTFRETYELESSGLTALELPRSFEVSNGLGVVAVTVHRDGERLVLERRLVIRSLEVPESKRAEAIEMRRALRKASTTSIVFGVSAGG